MSGVNCASRQPIRVKNLQYNSDQFGGLSDCRQGVKCRCLTCENVSRRGRSPWRWVLGTIFCFSHTNMVPIRKTVCIQFIRNVRLGGSMVCTGTFGSGLDLFSLTYSVAFLSPSESRMAHCKAQTKHLLTGIFLLSVLYKQGSNSHETIWGSSKTLAISGYNLHFILHILCFQKWIIKALYVYAAVHLVTHYIP